MKSSRIKTPAKLPKTPKRINSANNLSKDPVQVFCRIRPIPDSDLLCVKVAGSNSIILTPPELAVNYKSANLRETQYIFKHVFDDQSKQHEVFSTVAQPLVENLIRGKNGLLFTYGVTGSGKTYTMTGDAQNRGIMPRCLDALFKTISDYQAKKFVFKPDRLNGFDILSDADAMLERQALLNSASHNKLKRKNSDIEIASRASAEASILSGIDEDNIYSVFITYIEIYNNSVYDLLEEPNNQKTLQSKIIREDANHNMYVHGVSELEIKSVDDAIDAFQIGQKRKRMGHTILNSESSRSHSVFTVRLVQAPVDSQGEHAHQDKRSMVVSQLSLVDLAGSERTNRTKNTGQRLREAGNINNSLMTLRSCLEILRENQLTSGTKMIPYRDSKVTHLFKNYFDGEGQVKMVVCINPRAEDYDENSQVMKFAELTQEVQVTRSIPNKVDPCFTPGRRKANQLFKMAVNHLEENGYSEARKLEVDLGLVYSLGPSFPDFKLHSPENEKTLKELVQFLEQRIQKRILLCKDFDARRDRCRMLLMDSEKENYTVRAENTSLKGILKQERQKNEALEHKILLNERVMEEMSRKNREIEAENRELRSRLDQQHALLRQTEFEKQKQKAKFNSKMASESDKMSRELEQKLQAQKCKLSERMRVKDEKLRLVSNILAADTLPNIAPIYRSNSSENILQDTNPTHTTHTSTVTSAYHGSRTPKPVKGVPVVNIRHRRSKSAGERWLEHRAPNPVPLGTILQPYFKSRKSITKLTDVKDVVNNKTSKYCLISQQADTDGELETKLYKGDVIPTMAGGAQIVFNDVECLKQKSPNGSPSRKRLSQIQISSTPITASDVRSKCSVSIEGHHNKKPRL